MRKLRFCLCKCGGGFFFVFCSFYRLYPFMLPIPASDIKRNLNLAQASRVLMNEHLSKSDNLFIKKCSAELGHFFFHSIGAD